MFIIYRLNSQKNSYKGDSKNKCLQVLRLAIELDVEFVEIDFEVVPVIVFKVITLVDFPKFQKAHSSEFCLEAP